MLAYYFQSQEVVLATTIQHHLERMAEMDEQYGARALYPQCWKRQ